MIAMGTRPTTAFPALAAVALAIVMTFAAANRRRNSGTASTASSTAVSIRAASAAAHDIVVTAACFLGVEEVQVSLAGIVATQARTMAAIAARATIARASSSSVAETGVVHDIGVGDDHSDSVCFLPFRFFQESCVPHKKIVKM